MGSDGSLALNSIDESKVSRLYDEPEWLGRIRSNSFSYYKSLSYETSPLFNKYTIANAIDGNDLSILVDDRKVRLADEIAQRINDLKDSNSIVLLQNGIKMEVINIPDDIKADGLVIKDIKDAYNSKYSNIVEATLKRLDPSEDKFLALEQALFNSGYFIYVPKGLELEYPITVINVLQDGVSTFSLNMLVVDTSSKVKVVQELYSSHDNNNNSSSVTANSKQGYFELNIADIRENANVELVTTQGINSSNLAYFTNRKAFLAMDSRFNSYLGLFGSFASRCKVDNILEGTGAAAEHFNVIFANNSQISDVTANMIHIKANTIGRVLSKSIVKDTARSLFKGMIRIVKDAKGSESYLAGHAIILNKGARADSIPALEIETNEVKATHSASVAQIDEEQIFYMMSRGMSRDDAKRAIVFGFVEPLLKRLSKDARIYTTYLIDCKWRNRPLILLSDDVMKEIWEVEEESRRVEADIFEKHYKYR
jgi:Fe-S cluster assembly protein SufB/Fe-S cluster assembly protein SufD